MSLISALRKETKKLFPTFLTCLKTFQEDDPIVLFDRYQYRDWNEHEKSFVGHLVCGESCFIMKYLLEQKGFSDIQVFRNSRRTEYGIEDHVFLNIDNIIIDPTYRQFFLDYRSINSKCLFRKTIYHSMEPFLINYQYDLELILKNLLKINEFCYNEPFTDYNEIKKYWEFKDEVTPRYQLNKVMNERERLDGLPPEYTRLVDCIDSFK